MRVFAIVPAAGTSERMGRPKLLLPWRNHSVLDEVLMQWSRSAVTETIVVAGELAGIYGPIARRHQAVLLAPDPHPAEMIDSIRAAVAWLQARHPTSGDAVMVAPADQPRISAELIDCVLAAHTPERPRVLQPAAGPSRGHPVLIPWKILQGIDSLPPQATLRDLLADVPRSVVPWPTGADWEDIDTPEDYERLR